MWERALIKSEAKMRLKQYYWSAFCVSIILSIITGITSGIINFSTNLLTGFLNTLIFYASSDALIVLLIVALAIIILSTAMIFLVQVLLNNILSVGINRFFLESRVYPSGLERMFFGFTSGGRYYKNIAMVLFMRDLKLFGWSLLSAIPTVFALLGLTFSWWDDQLILVGMLLLILGILLTIPVVIKSYEYQMIPYLLAERPDMPWRRAFELSKLMTDNEKGRMWVLDLSFMGWWILGLLTCGIGILFVNPYYCATKAELYTALREKAFGLGFAQPDELCGFFQQ